MVHVWTRLVAAIAVCILTCVSARVHAADFVWKEVFNDSGTAGDWHEKWVLDGAGTVKYSDEGLQISAGSSKSDHTVLWAKPVVEGDVKITYTFTRVDSKLDVGVNILFIQASGAKDKPDDIFEWKRPDAAYNLYWGDMNCYGISYANRQNEVRARHNAGKTLLQVYTKADMFQVGRETGITVLKEGREFSMTAVDSEKDLEKTWEFTANPTPVVDHGRIGLRLMGQRASTFKDIKVFVKDTLATRVERGSRTRLSPLASRRSAGIQKHVAVRGLMQGMLIARVLPDGRTRVFTIRGELIRGRAFARHIP